MSNNNNNRIYSLQMLRGISALMVVLYHIKGFTNAISCTNTSFYNIIPELFGMGAPIFFGISGFIMAYIINGNPKHFLSKRLLRIYPPFIIAATLVILTNLMCFGTASYYELYKSMTLLPFGSSPTYVLGIEWTLIYEIFFYFICTVFASKRTQKLFLPFLLIWAVVISIGCFAYGKPTIVTPTIYEIPFSTLNYFFIFGALAFYLTKVIKPKSDILIYVSGLLTTVGFLTIYYTTIYKISLGAFYLILSLFVGLAIYFISCINVSQPNILSLCGDYSYGIYLMHPQVIVITLTVWKDKLHLPINDLASTFTLISALLISWQYGKFELYLNKKIKHLSLPKINYRKAALYLAIPLFLLVFPIITYINLLTAMPVFDSSKVISDNSAGWVETVSDYETNKNDSIIISGWAVDPFINKPAPEVIAVVDDKIIPSTVTRTTREGLSQVFGTDDVLMSGFTMEINSKHLPSKSSITIYAKLSNDTYLPLLSNQPIDITVK